MAKLIALSKINHDGKDFDEGDEFEVKDAKQVEQLRESGAVLVKGDKTAAAQAAS